MRSRPPSDREEGLVSYYHDSLAGKPTASGEPYDPRAATCAHKRHAFGTYLEVTLVGSDRSVICRVNDRGPYPRGRIVDLSRSLAAQLGIVQRGVAPVIVRKVGYEPPAR